jgi:hypothetical protein
VVRQECFDHRISTVDMHRIKSDQKLENFVARFVSEMFGEEIQDLL